MLRKLKTVLVESYVGAIAIGMLISQAVVHFASMFSAPITQRISLRQYRSFSPSPEISATFSLRPAIPELIRCVVIFAVSYLLLRWLYLKPAELTESLPENHENPRSDTSSP